MILKDLVSIDFVMAVNNFITKRGTDAEITRKLVDTINNITGEKSLDAIYVNSTDNIMIPDVAVTHVCNIKGFGGFMFDANVVTTCCFGYTIEIHQRCFNYSAEMLAAIILHDVAQNVMSDSMKIRFLKAYTAAISKYKPDQVEKMLTTKVRNDVAYIGATQICLRPFHVPTKGYDYVATDEILRVTGLAPYYDRYVEQKYKLGNLTSTGELESIEEYMEHELKDDFRDISTLVDACMDNDLRHYFTLIANAVPIHAFTSMQNTAETEDSFIGFRSRIMTFIPKRREDEAVRRALDEAVHVHDEYDYLKSDIAIQFEIDKIISSLRYAETEGEREVLLFRIKNLQLKLISKINHCKRHNDKERIKKIQCYLDQLEGLRKTTVEKEIKTKRWSVYVKDQLPAGYDF